MKKMNRKLYRLLCLIVFSVGMMTCFFTLAYFTSKDDVTNTFHSKGAEIILSEPGWDNEGQKYASELVPGVLIKKDPYITSTGEADVIVRMRLSVLDKDDKDITATDRGRKIIDYIRMNGGTAFPKYDSLGNLTGYSNSKFFYTLDDEQIYFYYVGDNTGDDPNMQILHTGDRTETLFDYIDIPALKSEFGGIFDESFTIKVDAEGVAPYVDEEGNVIEDKLTVSENASRF